MDDCEVCAADADGPDGLCGACRRLTPAQRVAAAMDRLIARAAAR